MKRSGLLILLIILLQVSVVFAAPVVVLDNAVVNPGDTSVDIELWIYTDNTSPVDTAAFTDSEITGFNLTGVNVESFTNWFSTVALPQFGSTDFGFPATPITSNSLFATLTYSFASDFFQPGDEVNIAFSSLELADDLAAVYSSVTVNGGNVSLVPIPGALWLLGSGLIGMVGIRRKLGK